MKMMAEYLSEYRTCSC